MLAFCTTTYTVLDNEEGHYFRAKFLAIHEWGGAKVRVEHEKGVIKLSVDSIVETEEIIYGS